MAWERVKEAGRFLWSNLDTVLVMSVATVVVVLDIVLPDLDPQVVSSAILALLGATGFVLLRERRGRTDLTEISQVAADALSDLSYDIIWQENEWEFHNRSDTTIRTTQRLRFTHNEVSELPHWSSGDGDITRCEAKWRRGSDANWITAEEINQLATRNGTKAIFSLGEEHSRGDMLDWRIERDASDRFSTSHESVTHDAKTDSDFPRRVRLFWPADEPPSHIEMRLGDQPARPLTGKSEGARIVIDETVGRLRKGEAFTVSWNW